MVAFNILYVTYVMLQSLMTAVLVVMQQRHMLYMLSAHLLGFLHLLLSGRSAFEFWLSLLPGSCVAMSATWCCRLRCLLSWAGDYWQEGAGTAGGLPGGSR